MGDLDRIIDLGREALLLTLVLASPVLAVGLVVALIVGVLQAATQVQDATLSFIPKIAAMLLAAMVFGSWIFSRLIEFSRMAFGGGP